MLFLNKTVVGLVDLGLESVYLLSQVVELLEIVVLFVLTVLGYLDDGVVELTYLKMERFGLFLQGIIVIINI